MLKQNTPAPAMSNQAQAAKQPTQWARTRETAEHFKVSAMTLYRWRKCPTFPKVLKRSSARNGAVLFNIQAMENWLDGGEIAQ